MREIKFRAWNNSIKMFSKPFNPKKDFFIEFDYWIKHADGEDMLRIEIQRQDVQWHQYTGLRDIDGNDIYEWDIVSYSVPQAGLNESKTFHQVVEWQNAVTGYQRNWRHLWKVIGNIYENPELLNN